MKNNQMEFQTHGLSLLKIRLKRKLFSIYATISPLILLFCSAIYLFASDGARQEISASRDLNYAQVLFVKAVQSGDILWRFDVTVRHNDEGWEHYADAWQIVDPEIGQVIAERVLAHPHENEQPFTRSLGNIKIPRDMKAVVVRAKCNIHGFGGHEVVVDLTIEKGENFEVKRTEQ